MAWCFGARLANLAIRARNAVLSAASHPTRNVVLLAAARYRVPGRCRVKLLPGLACSMADTRPWVMPIREATCAWVMPRRRRISASLKAR